MRPSLAALLAGANFAVALGYGAILPLLPAPLDNVSAAAAYWGAALVAAASGWRFPPPSPEDAHEGHGRIEGTGITVGK